MLDPTQTFIFLPDLFIAVTLGSERLFLWASVTARTALMVIYRFHWIARAVQAKIATMLDDTALRAGFQVISLGGGLPVACNDTLWGQNQNGIVEIWAK